MKKVLLALLAALMLFAFVSCDEEQKTNLDDVTAKAVLPNEYKIQMEYKKGEDIFIYEFYKCSKGTALIQTKGDEIEYGMIINKVGYDYDVYSVVDGVYKHEGEGGALFVVPHQLIIDNTLEYCATNTELKELIKYAKDAIITEGAAGNFGDCYLIAYQGVNIAIDKRSHMVVQIIDGDESWTLTAVNDTVTDFPVVPEEE